VAGRVWRSDGFGRITESGRDALAITDARIGALRERPLQGAVEKGIPEASYRRLLEARRVTMLVALAAMNDELVAAAQGAARALLEQR
jgi:hypothetical protein